VETQKRKSDSKRFSGALLRYIERVIFKGVFIDFDDTLAYFDEVKNREYETVLVSMLKKYGYERRPKDLASVLVQHLCEEHKRRTEDCSRIPESNAQETVR